MREHVLATASELFYREGIRATSIGRIVDVATIAPTSLYRLFAAKDDLITAYVERAAAEYRAWAVTVLRAGGPSPEEQLSGFMSGVGEQITGSHCRGCPFQLVLAEFPDRAHPAHRAAGALKRWVLAQLCELAGRAGASDPIETGYRLMLLSEGAHAGACSLCSAEIARHTVGAAIVTLRASVR